MRAMRFALVLAVVVAACGGGGGDKVTVDAPGTGIDAPPDAPEIAPVFRNPVTLPDDQLAVQALQIIGADVGGAQSASCNSCHGMTRTSIGKWKALSDTAMASCFTDLTIATPASALAMIDCMRSMPGISDSDFMTQKLGVYASAGRLPWFRFLFKRAYGPAAFQAQLDVFESSAAMPRGDTVTPLTQPQFDIVAEWFARGVPQLAANLTDGQGSVCTAGISADVAAHVTAMHTMGWQQKNADNTVAMYGCGAATDPKLCLQDHALATTHAYGTGWDLASRGHARLLKDVTYKSFYWTRSSPDGRFIAHGSYDPGSYVIDLQRDVVVTVNNTQYDPGFFPDGAGWVFQGGQNGTPKNNVCSMSVLTSDPSVVTMTESACTRASSMGLYQHVGRALDGGDYFAIDGQFNNDNGGHSLTEGDPPADFDNQAYLDFTPMVYDGAKFTTKAYTDTKTPYEGDWVLSPSSKLVISRVAGAGGAQQGFALYKVTQTPSGATYTTSISKIARYCTTGAKPNFSFDERFMTFHHYVTAADYAELGFASASDAGFQAYLAKGAANLYVMELTTGVVTRITNVAPGQYALYPHFRSDGWIYAVVRDTNLGHEYFVAHDGALILGQ